MNIAPLGLFTIIEVAIGLGLATRLMRQTKYEHAPLVRQMTIGDWGFATIVSVFFTSLAHVSPWLAIIAGAGVWLFLLLLWLDVALYGCLTFELSLADARDVVLSNLAAEVISMRSSRQFFWRRPLFLLLPLVLPLLLTLLFLNDQSHFRHFLEIFLTLYFIATLLHRILPATISSPRRRSFFIDFLIPRRPRISPGFEPRPEHLTLLASPTPSGATHPLHGQLRGRSIVLLTFESLGTTHLRPGQAHTPFTSSLLKSPNAITSTWHATPAPLTNAAHVAWYFGRWTLREPSPPTSHVALLASAGYRTIYLTAAQTAHYGLVNILKQSGFTHIIDGQSLAAANPTQGDMAVDSWLESIGLPEIEKTLQDHDGPFLLHIHAHNAHIPHHVEKPTAFARHDHMDDRGRFLNALEETDDLFSRLVHFIRTSAQRRNPDDAPIFIISSDHGQSFGEHNYRSHASATTAEQIQVPLTIHHPLLPAISAPFSSHFDVFPTVLDLVGLPLSAGFGQSLLESPRPPMHFLFDGEPARPTSTCLGVVIGEQKYSLDLLRDTLVQSNWDDENRRMLQGEERDYFEALIGVIAKKRGLA